MLSKKDAKLSLSISESFFRLEPWDENNSRVPSPLLSSSRNIKKLRTQKNTIALKALKNDHQHRSLCRNSSASVLYAKRSPLKYNPDYFRPKSIKVVKFGSARRPRNTAKQDPKFAHIKSRKKRAIEFPQINRLSLSPQIEKRLQIERKIYIISKGRK